MDFSPKTFSVADYVIFAMMLSISAAVGFYYAIKDRKKQNTEEYLLAGRSMSAYPVAFSLSVGFMSAVLVLGTPSEIYRYGTIYSWLLVSFIVMSVVTAEIYIPMFYTMRLTSVYEYLEQRFSRLIRIEGTILYIIQTILYVGIVIYAPALALNAVTGFNLWGAVISTGFICILYSSLGGLKAVIWTDAFQAVIMVVGFLSILIRGSVLMGGFENVWRRSEERGRIQFWKFDLDPRERHTPWTLTVGGTFIFLSLYAVNQGQVQRYLSCRSIREAKKAILLNIGGLWLLNILAILCGVTLYSYYKDCDPMLLGVVQKPDQLLPYMVLDFFQDYPGMPGVFIACVYSGSLSTISTAITGMASVTVEDFIKPFSKYEESTYTWMSRGLVVFYGILCMIFSYLVSTLGAILQAAHSVLGLIGGPLVGLYTLGFLFPFATTMGAFFGINIGIAANVWVFIGSKSYPAAPYFYDVLPLTLDQCPESAFFNATNQDKQMINTNESIAFTTNMPTSTTSMDSGTSIYSMSYIMYSAFGFMWTIVIGLIVSLLTGGLKKRSSVDSSLIYFLFFDHWLFKCIPEGVKKPLRCGVVHDQRQKKDVETPFIDF